MTDFNRIMIKVPNWVGDLVMSLPALRELRRIFTDAHVTLLARPWVAGLLEGEALADELFLIERGSLKGFLEAARELKSRAFDLAVLLQNAIGAALLAKAARARLVAGYPTDGRRLLLDLAIPFQPGHKKLHQVYYYLNVAAMLEEKLSGSSQVDLGRVTPQLRLTDAQRASGHELLVRSGIALDRPLAVISPGAANSRAKRWLPERFAQTADRLAANDGFQPVIIGAPGDEEAAQETAARMQSHAPVLAGRTSIAELKAILGCASLVISNDTGAAHVSAALGVPTVVVFGPTEHQCTRPFSPSAVVVRHEVYCSPCMLRDCPIDHRCMTTVAVSDVYTAARRLLARAAERS